MTTLINEKLMQMRTMIKNYVEKEVKPYVQKIEDYDKIPDHIVDQAKK